MSERPLRGALVGCGFFARNHMNAWSEIDGAEIVAVCDLERDRASAFARHFAVPAHYERVEELLEREELDFVDVVTQADTHRELVALVAASGRHVICQKPLAADLEEARAVVESAGTVTMMVHENFRWQHPMRRLKEAARGIGAPTFARISFRSGFDVYRQQPYLATDERFILYDLGVHLLDLARFFLGEASHLTCHTGRVNPDIVGEDIATVLLRMRNGAHGVVDLSYASRLEHERFPETLIHLEGERGSAVLDGDFRITVTNERGPQSFTAEPPRSAWMSSPSHVIQQSVVAIQRHWVECLRTGTQPHTSGRDNLATLELTFAAYDSADRCSTMRVGRWAPGEVIG